MVDRLVDSSSSVKTSSLELSIIMPCLNEAETLETCIKKHSGT
jgi:hypothetical protein